MSRLWLSNEATLKALTKALYGVIGMALVVALWCGVQLITANARATEAIQISKSHRIKLAELQTVVAKGEGIVAPDLPRGLAAIGAFQSALEKAAAQAKCALTEFTSSRTPAAYLSRYSKDAPGTTWSQVEVKLQLQGTARSILQTLDALAGLDIPFEMVSVDLTRQATRDRTEATLSANVELNVLIQTAEVTP